MSKFNGTGVALITPFRKDKSIDFAALGKLVEHVISNKCDYLVMMGTTSENPTLQKDEKSAVINHIIETAGNRVPIVVGIGGNNTQAIVDTINETDFSNIDGILSVAPYYNKPLQEGIYQHFREIARVAPVPVILYNVPGRTSSNILAETTLRLANEFSNIVAVKEASGNMSQIMQIVKNKPTHFSVLSGDDAITLPLISIGVSGVISVVANAYPFEFSEMVRLARANKFDEAYVYHYKLLDFIENLFVEGNPGGIKAALKELKICDNFLRLPLIPVSEKTQKKLISLMQEI